MDASVAKSENMEQFYTYRFSVFLLYLSAFFYSLFSHNKDLIRIMVKLVQKRERWHDEGFSQ